MAVSPFEHVRGVNALTASTTLTHDGFAGQKIALNAAAGLTVTLPEATGSGVRYDVYVIASVTSNAYVINCPASSEFYGHATLGQDSANTVVQFDAADNDDQISMNGSTTGGLKGARITLTDTHTGHWHAEIEGTATGTEATPFGTQ